MVFSFSFPISSGETTIAGYRQPWLVSSDQADT